MSSVESHGLSKTGRRSVSAYLSADGSSAARNELVWCGSLSTFTASGDG